MALELEVWQAPIVDNEGNIQPGAQVTVFNSDDTIATIYDDLNRTPRSNPFNVGSDALARFYAEPGRYRVQAQVGSDIAVFDNVDLSQKALREDLESESLGKGVAIIRRGVISIDTYAALKSLPEIALRADLTYQLNSFRGGYNATNIGAQGGGEFKWHSNSTADEITGVIVQVTGVTTGRLIRVKTDSIPIEAFGVQYGTPDDLTLNTARIQEAWDYSEATGTQITHLSPSLSQPYFAIKLFARSFNLKGVKNATCYQLPVSEWGGTGFFIDREDDGVRKLRGKAENILFATATSGVSAAQDQNQNMAAFCHVALESFEWQSCATWGFGQGGFIVARAEGGNEGLGFINTTQDGNYNTFRDYSTVQCGKYRANPRERAGIVLLYKANSNNFYATYCRGAQGASAVAIEYGTNNNFYGLTGESCDYPIIFGSKAGNNHAHDVRAEGCLAAYRAYPYDLVLDGNGNPLIFNNVSGIHQSGTPLLSIKDEGSNVFDDGTAQNPLNRRTARRNTTSTLTYGLVDVLGAKCTPDDPFLIMATNPDGTETNGAQYLPRTRLISNHTGPATNQITGSYEFTNGRAPGSGGGVNAKLDAVHVGVGNTAISIKTGVGNEAFESLFIQRTNPADSVYGFIRPGYDNLQDLGTGSFRYKDIYAGNDVIQTSDAREKTDVRSMSDAELAVAKQLSKEVGIYQFLNAVAKKGSDGARLHIGMTVQRAIEIFEQNGLDAFRYGVVCYDEWEAEVEQVSTAPATYDEDGNLLTEEYEYVSHPGKEAGNRYSFRYDQLEALMIAGINARLEALE